MKLVATIRLLPENEVELRDTLERCNAACTWLAALGARHRIRGKRRLQAIGYSQLRQRFDLSAQAAIRCIYKVADAFKVTPRGHAPQFRRHAAQPYDIRIFRFLPGQDAISIWTVGGRRRVPFVCDTRARALLRYAKGEIDLCFVRGKWILAATCEMPDAPLTSVADALGIDLGIVNLATNNHGAAFSGADIDKVRARHHKRRRALQKTNTRSAKRALRRAAGKQARFQRYTNHVISKAIVADAERGRCLIALEDLAGIRDRVKVRRRQRTRMANWAFSQLRGLIEYKAALKGIAVVFIDPRNTSRECPCCGHIAKGNRPTRDKFLCLRCGFAGPADHIAALNIRRRGLRATSFVVALEGTTLGEVLPQPVSPKESRLL